MFLATLKNKNASVQESIEIEFPLPEDQYEKAIHTLTEFHIGAALKQDCYVADIYMEGCTALERMIDTMANVDELDWLARKLEDFGRYELLKFNAAVERFGLMEYYKSTPVVHLRHEYCTECPLFQNCSNGVEFYSLSEDEIRKYLQRRNIKKRRCWRAISTTKALHSCRDGAFYAIFP